MNKVSVLDIRFSNISDEELLNVLTGAFKSDSNLRIVTPNPEIVMAANKSDDLKEMINNSTLVLKDGIGIKIAEKLKGIEGEKRQTGIETLERLLEIANENGYSVYCVGAKDEILQKAIVNIKSKFPNIVVKGQHNGYFKDGSPEEEQILKDIEEKKPDLLIAAMGFPKQEIFLTKTEAPKVSIACGGSLDVMSGEVKRAPRWMQKVGLEWFYRLIKDPGRIKRQIVIPVFLWKIVFTKNSCFMEENND